MNSFDLIVPVIGSGCSGSEPIRNYGLIRYYFPKDRDFGNITDKKIIHAIKRLNNRPRKRLGYKTQNEVFFGRNVPILSGESYNVALTT